ncbi:MAG: glycerol-3-phosphate acyltransferase, partial [Pseudonocardiales bacterium]|nr:glycerol-3-phosphate acyltransferase [Pseudonocardiales bacterium]
MSTLWPVTAGEDVILIAEAMSSTEKRCLQRWLKGNKPGSTKITTVYLPDSDTPTDANMASLSTALGGTADAWLVPVGVVWEQATAKRKSTTWRDIVLMGDPRRPRKAVQAWVGRKHPERCQIVVAASARVSELRARFAEAAPHDRPDESTALAEFVARQANVAIESAISRRLGPQYKVPRLMRQEIASSTRFDKVVGDLSGKLKRPKDEVRTEAETALDEMVTGWSRLLVDVQANFGRSVYRRGYDERIEYNAEQVEKVRAAVASRPAVVLMSHRSHLDGLVLPVAMLDNKLPRTHLLGGANMAIWPIGNLFRRAGVIFIRREFRDDQVYKAVLREYVGHLVEKRFHLQWSIEGTRSRTGKMEPPKLGLLAYVVDAYRQGRTEDVMLVPVSIAYDQLHEVGEFAAYARGAEKKPENLGYIVKYLRAQGEHFGKIYVSFGEPISVREELTREGSDERDPNELYKLAFEVSWRMNQVTPITGAALVTTVLLAAQGRALTLEQIREPLAELLDYSQRRKLPMASSAQALHNEQGVKDILSGLTRHHVVQYFGDGLKPVWRVARNQHLAASFYRNSLIHHFLDRGIAELALVKVAQEESDAPLQLFWDEAHRLRNLLKFDFFFPEKDEFTATIGADLQIEAPN